MEDFYPKFEELLPIHLELIFKKIKEIRKVGSSFCEVSITLIPSTDKASPRGKHYRSASFLIIGAEILN